MIEPTQGQKGHFLSSIDPVEPSSSQAFYSSHLNLLSHRSTVEETGPTNYDESKVSVLFPQKWNFN